MSRHAPALMFGCLAGVLLSAPLAADTTHGADTPAPALTSADTPENPPTPPAPATPPATGTDQTAAGSAKPPPSEEALSEVIIQTNEPKFVAPTRRDRIGRIWAPVFIDGKGPYRLVLDTGATRSAVTVRTAQSLGTIPIADGSTLVTGFTGSAIVPTIHVDHMEVGELYIGPSNLPVLQDVFGGAQGVLGIEGMEDKRIYADFRRDKLVISRSHGERARRDFTVVPLHLIHNLLVADVRVGRVHAKAIVDTGAQGTVGNLALKRALMRRSPQNAAHEDIVGVTLDVQGGDNLPMPDIDFGHLQVKGVHVTFGDMYLFQHWHLTDEPTLTLGMDLLGSFDVLIIDYSRRELQIELRNSSPFS